MKFINKKGAMFGLDARIALAIFGALSVISGAALYSAIQNSKATALLVELQEVAKAFEQYYLDTYSYPTLAVNPTCGIPCHFTIDSLINDTDANNFKGPYLSYSVVDHYSLEDGKGKVIAIIQTSSDQPWGLSANWNTEPCSSGRQCGNWVIMGGFSDANLFKKLDDKIDSSDGGDNGAIRWRVGSDPWDYHIFYKFMDVKNTN